MTPTRKKREVLRLTRRERALVDVIGWALGERGEFRGRNYDPMTLAWLEGPYYWRGEMRHRLDAALRSPAPTKKKPKRRARR